MTIVLQLKPEVEARAQAQAEARGISLQEYLEHAIEHITSPLTGAELLAQWDKEGVLGAWARRDDITDSAAYARELRRQSEARERS